MQPKSANDQHTRGGSWTKKRSRTQRPARYRINQIVWFIQSTQQTSVRDEACPR